jgi:signal transduction histidine kinase
LKVSGIVSVPREQALGSPERRRAERLAALGTLAAGLAHEIRNPLNSALLKLQVLERRLRHADRADPLEVVDTIRAELGRVDHLLSDFLAFAEPLTLDVVRADLNGLVTELAGSVTSSAAMLGVEVELEVDPALGQVELDATRLRGVLSGLIENALEAMPEGGVLWLRTRARDADGFVRVEIEDTGPGFPSDAPIFDPFYTTKASGTGLGLSIAHRVLSDHGGRILAETFPGRTRFTLLLPA